MNNKILTWVVMVALVISVGSWFNGGQDGRDGRDGVSVGGAAGPTKTNHQFFLSGYTSGGRIATTSTATAYTMIRQDFGVNGFTYMDWTPDNIVTITIDATSTYGMVPKVGDVANIYWRNASSTAGANITFAAGSGLDIQFVEATGGDLVLGGLDWEKMTFIRESAFFVTLLLNEFVEGD